MANETDADIEDDHPHAKFLKGSTLKHVAVMSASATVGLMAIFLVDFVDFWFLSQLGIVEIQAALGFAGTILFANISLSVGLMIACVALVSRAVGAEKMEDAQHIASAAMVYIVVLLGIVGITTAIYAEEILRYLGATGKTLELAESYLIIIAPSLPMLGIMMGMAGIMRAVGDAKRSAYVTLISAIVNGALDPIFIFVLDMGIEGAATASVTARFAGAFYGIYCVIKIHDMWTIPHRDYMTSTLRPYVLIAIPAVLTNLATPFSNGYMQVALAEYGDAAVAGFSYVNRLVPLAFGALFALSGAIGPIIGQNYGARKMDRVKNAYLDGIIFAVGYTAFVCVILILTRNWMADQFAIVGEARELAIAFIWIGAPLYIFNGLLFVSNATFNTLSFATYATVFNWGRATLGTIPFIMAGAYYADAIGVVIGHALGAIPFGIGAVIMGWLIILRLEKDPVYFAKHSN